MLLPPPWPLPTRNRYNEWVMCLKGTDGDEDKCKPVRQMAMSICPEDWVSAKAIQRSKHSLRPGTALVWLPLTSHGVLATLAKRICGCAHGGRSTVVALWSSPSQAPPHVDLLPRLPPRSTPAGTRSARRASSRASSSAARTPIRHSARAAACARIAREGRAPVRASSKRGLSWEHLGELLRLWAPNLARACLAF